MTTPKRAVLYARVSTPKQKARGVSLETQQEMAAARCAAEGWALTHTYMDVMTGKSPRRPGVLQLIEDAKAKKFDVAVFYRVDRGGRTARFWHGELLATLDDHDIGLVSLTQDIDATTSTGRFILGQYILLAEKESADISQRVSDNMRTLAARGRWVAGGRVPYGYKLIAGHTDAEGNHQVGRLVVEPAEAEVVGDIFERFIESRSIRHVVQALNEEGRRSRRGALWRADTVRHILASPIYAGHLTYGKYKEHGPTRRRVRQERDSWTVVKNAHEAIVSDETIEAAAAILDENTGKAPRVKFAERRHPWSGLLYCAACGRKMARQRVGKNPASPFAVAYVCLTYCQSGKSACPDYAYLNEHLLRTDVLPALSARCAEAHARQLATGPASAPACRRPVDFAARIAVLEEKKALAWESHVRSGGVFSAEKRDAILTECDREIAEITARAAETRTPIAMPTLPADLLNLWDGLDEPAQGQLLRTLIERVEVSTSECRVLPMVWPDPEWAAPMVFQVGRRHAR